MKNNGFHASTSISKKTLAVSIIIALALAAVSVVGVFAAPKPAGGPTSAFGAQMRELNAAAVWYNNARQNPANFVNTSDPVRAQQYLSQYAFALRQAQTIVAGRSANTANNNNNSNNNNNNGSSTGSGSNSSIGNTQFGSAHGDLASWLHMMRGLRGKLAGIGFSNGSLTGNSLAGAGVPVTGGNSSSSSSSGTGTNNSAATPTATPTTSSSSSSSSAATPTTAPTTSSSSSSSSSAATPTSTPTTSSSSSSGTGTSSSSNGIPNTGNTGTQNTTVTSANHSALMKIWGPQFRELEAARVWLNNFKSNPSNLSTSDPAKTQQWLSQYAFALRQADAIIVGRGTTTTNNQSNNNANNNSSNGTSNGNIQFGSARGDLAQWLHMMRDLQVKLTSGVNGPNGSIMP